MEKLTASLVILGIFFIIPRIMVVVLLAVGLYQWLGEISFSPRVYKEPGKKKEEEEEDDKKSSSYKNKKNNNNKG